MSEQPGPLNAGHDPFTVAMPFAAKLGIRIEHAEPEEVRGRLDWAADLCTSAGILHGGAVMTLADSTGATCAFLNLPEGAGTSTIESKTNFFRAVREGHVEVHLEAAPRREDHHRRSRRMSWTLRESGSPGSPRPRLCCEPTS